jgi:hypothetical protein
MSLLLILHKYMNIDLICFLLYKTKTSHPRSNVAAYRFFFVISDPLSDTMFDRLCFYKHHRTFGCTCRNNNTTGSSICRNHRLACYGI